MSFLPDEAVPRRRWNRKYDFTDETIERDGYVYHRIRAKKTFTLVTGEVVKKGDLGGFIEKEVNLSHDGNCWVKDNARAGGYMARIYDNALLADQSAIGIGVELSGNAYVHGMSSLSLSVVTDNAEVKDSELSQIYAGEEAKIISSVLRHNARCKDGVFLEPNVLRIKGSTVIEHNIVKKDCKSEKGFLDPK